MYRGEALLSVGRLNPNLINMILSKFTLILGLNRADQENRRGLAY